MDEIELKINKEWIKRNIHIVIIIIATILALILVSPMLKDGVLTNIDHSVHYARLWCLGQSNILPPAAWCPEFQAGYPVVSYYYPIIDLATVYTGKIIGLASSYKLFVTLTLFVLGAGAYFLLRSFGHKLAGAIAYALIVLNAGSWYTGGFNEIFLVGMWAQVMTTGFLLISFALFVEFYKKPSYKTMFFAVISTMFITHPVTLVVAAFLYTFTIILQWNESIKKIKWIGSFILFSLLVNGYYILHLLVNGKYIFWQTWGTMSFSDFQGYFLSAMPWYFMVAAAIGLVIAMRKEYKENKGLILFGLIILIYTLITFLPGLSGRLFVGLKVVTYTSMAIFIFAGLFFEYLATTKILINEKHIKFGLIISLALVVLMLYPMWTQSLQLSQDGPIIIPETQLQALFGPLQNLAPGRIAIEDTLYNSGQSPLTFTHLTALVPAYSGMEIVGVPYQYPQYVSLISSGGDNGIFSKKFSDYQPGELESIFEHYNIRYIFAESPAWIGYFENRTKAETKYGPFTIFETNITPSYFIVNNGSNMGEQYEGLEGKVMVNMSIPGFVSMKVNKYNNWKAYIDGQASKREFCEGLVCTQVPIGQHLVEFKYTYTYVEYIGYVITILSIIVLCYYAYNRKRRV